MKLVFKFVYKCAGCAHILLVAAKDKHEAEDIVNYGPNQMDHADYKLECKVESLVYGGDSGIIVQ